MLFFYCPISICDICVVGKVQNCLLPFCYFFLVSFIHTVFFLSFTFFFLMSGPLMFYDSVSWALSVKALLRLSLSFIHFHSLYQGLLRELLFPIYFLLASHGTSYPSPFQLFSRFDPFFFSLSVCFCHVLWFHSFVLWCPDILIPPSALVCLRASQSLPTITITIILFSVVLLHWCNLPKLLAKVKTKKIDTSLYSW